MMFYSQRLGEITIQQFQAEAVPYGNFGQNVFLTSTTGKYVFRGKPHYDWQFASEQFMANLFHEKTSIPVPYPYYLSRTGWKSPRQWERI